MQDTKLSANMQPNLVGHPAPPTQPLLLALLDTLWKPVYATMRFVSHIDQHLHEAAWVILSGDLGCIIINIQMSPSSALTSDSKGTGKILNCYLEDIMGWVRPNVNFDKMEMLIIVSLFSFRMGDFTVIEKVCTLPERTCL